MPLTLDEARARGWQIAGARAWAPKAALDTEPTLEVHVDGDPLPALLNNISEREGVGDTIGYGAAPPKTPPVAPGADLAAAIVAAIVVAVPNADAKAVEQAALDALAPDTPDTPSQGATP